MDTRSDIERARWSLQEHIREVYAALQEARRMADAAAKLREESAKTIQRAIETQARLKEWRRNHER